MVLDAVDNLFVWDHNNERVLRREIRRLLRYLQRLQQLGMGLHLDDFGTGHFSLSILDRFPFDTLKIDQGFVHSLAHLTRQRRLLGGIMAIASSLDLSTIAEDVETQIQLDALQTLDCRQVQGFYFGKPLNPGRMGELAQHGPLTWVATHREQRRRRQTRIG